MAFPQIGTPSAGPLTAADLDRSINTGRIFHLRRATMPWCDTIPTQPAGLDQQGRHKTRPFGASAYGELRTVTQPRVIPLSTTARWLFELRRWWLG